MAGQGEMEFLGVSDSRPNSIRAKPGHIACELSSLHPKDIRGIVAESEALRWRLFQRVPFTASTEPPHVHRMCLGSSVVAFL